MPAYPTFPKKMAGIPSGDGKSRESRLQAQNQLSWRLSTAKDASVKTPCKGILVGFHGGLIMGYEASHKEECLPWLIVLAP